MYIRLIGEMGIGSTLTKIVSISPQVSVSTPQCVRRRFGFSFGATGIFVPAGDLGHGQNRRHVSGERLGVCLYWKDHPGKHGRGFVRCTTRLLRLARTYGMPESTLLCLVVRVVELYPGRTIRPHPIYRGLGYNSPPRSSYPNPLPPPPRQFCEPFSGCPCRCLPLTPLLGASHLTRRVARGPKTRG